MSATFSECGCYRYALRRTWDPRLSVLGYVMLNPSTADGERDDPTIKRCVHFARENGFGGIWVTNLFALRATDPAAVYACAPEHAAGPGNLGHVHEMSRGVGGVVLAWGNHGSHFPQRVEQVTAVLRVGDAPLYHLGLTSSGQPKHPLARGKSRIPNDQRLIEWGGA